MPVKNVSVIGAGTMGNGIAHVFAQHGYTVQLIDVNAASLEKAIATITKNEIMLTNGELIPIGEQYRSQINRKHIDSNLVSRSS